MLTRMGGVGTELQRDVSFDQEQWQGVGTEQWSRVGIEQSRGVSGGQLRKRGVGTEQQRSGECAGPVGSCVGTDHDQCWDSWREVRVGTVAWQNSISEGPTQHHRTYSNPLGPACSCCCCWGPVLAGPPVSPSCCALPVSAAAVAVAFEGTAVDTPVACVPACDCGCACVVCSAVVLRRIRGTCVD